MSLAGQGAIAIWQDAPAEVRAEFYAWHNREHMPERVGIPGFLRARRWVALAGTPQFFHLYETDSTNAHTGADYTLRLNHPSAWTKRIAPKLVDNIRSLCRVAFTLGTGQGGLLVALRYDVAGGQEDLQRRLLAHGVLPELVERPGIAAAHLLIADTVASAVVSVEKKDRPQQARVPAWIVLVEGGADAPSLEAACAELLPDAALKAAGATGIERGLYQLQYSRTKTPSTVG